MSTSTERADARNHEGHTLWFLGWPAAGKTTLATRVARSSANYVLLDGDEVRKLVGNFDMGQNARLTHLSYMAFCCRQLNERGVNVAAAFVTPLHEHRERIRAILPAVKFIWLRCSAPECARRDPKGLWRKAARGDMPQLTGAGGDWEDPIDCALVIRTDEVTVEQAFQMIRQQFPLP